MSPRDLDAAVVQRRLALLAELLEDLAGLDSVDRDRLVRDRLLRRALERILTQLVDTAVDINGHVGATVLGQAATDYRSSFELAATAGVLDPTLAAQLRPAVGLRNVLVHEYVDADLDIIAGAVDPALAAFSAYRRAVASWLQARADS